jgi:phosphoribosyl 1,2-cyclic phosphodiesterase
MVRFTVLASGSRGNSTVVCGGHTRILVDAGLSCRELFRRMRLAGEEPERLDAIIVTHEHQDHINGLAVTARKLGIPVYFTEATHRAWMRWLTPRRQMTYAQWLEQCRRQAAARQAEPEPPANDQEADESDLLADAAGADSRVAEPDPGVAEPDPMAASMDSAGADAPMAARTDVKGKREDPTWLPSVEYFQSGRPFAIGDIAVSPFTTSHDAADPVGFVFSAEGARLAIATDLGYISPNVKAQLKGVDLLLLESNHDLEMLRDGPYPWAVKQRVLSRVGHLSNEATSEFLESGYDGQATYVVLAHLSENNNLPELARISAERALCGRASLLANRLLIAMQHEPLSSITL